MSTGTSCHSVHLLQVLKKFSLKSDSIHYFFMILYMYIAPGQGQKAPRGQSFDVNRNVLSLHSYTFFFHDLIHIYSPGEWADSPQGTKF